MRNYRIQVEGRLYQVLVEQVDKDRLGVTLDGEVFQVERAGRGDVAAWKIRRKEEVVHAQTRVIQGDRVDVWMGGVVFPSSVQAIGSGAAAPPTLTGRGRVGGEIHALMPGRITSILVGEGEAVEAGTPLLILEAMKMQNEINSPIVGRVKSILVSEGETVKKDATLIVVE
jgi:biotin carboxyl carrier protein